MTKQWDKYREIIIAEYKDQNKPLHEVQRVMLQRYGFRASTRAYRSRFDRWGVHKYSRRRCSMSLGRRGSSSDGDGPISPRQSPDMDDQSPQSATPVVATPNELLTSGICVPPPGVDFRSYVKTEYPYTPVTPAPSPSVGHSPGFPVNQFGSGLAAFNSQNVGCYSSSSVPMYQQDPRDVVMIAPGTTGSAHSTLSMTGIPTAYRYSLALLTAHE